MPNRRKLLGLLRRRRAVQFEFAPWNAYSGQVAGVATALIRQPPSRDLQVDVLVRNTGDTLDLRLKALKTGAEFRVAVSKRGDDGHAVMTDILDRPGSLRWGGIEYGRKGEADAACKLSDWLRQQKLPAIEGMAPVKVDARKLPGARL